MPGPPEWSGFWAGIERRIRVEQPRPMRDPWWLPVWKPFWGHPRLALASAVTGLAAVALLTTFHPIGQSRPPAAWAAPVMVQDAGTADPDGTVMVYSSPDQDVTVIWLFGSDSPNPS
jgi:hypothetical protein